MITLRLLLFCFLSASSSVYANNTLEVYLNNGMTITGIEDAEKRGISIAYYYLDDINKIEEQMSKRVTAQLQDEINAIVKEIGLEKLSAMNAFERNQLLLKQMQSSHIDLQASLVTPHDREAIRRSQEVLQYAQDQGISNDMLPAMIFKGKLFKNTADITAALDFVSTK